MAAPVKRTKHREAPKTRKQRRVEAMKEVNKFAAKTFKLRTETNRVVQRVGKAVEQSRAFEQPYKSAAPQQVAYAEAKEQVAVCKKKMRSFTERCRERIHENEKRRMETFRAKLSQLAAGVSGGDVPPEDVYDKILTGGVDLTIYDSDGDDEMETNGGELLSSIDAMRQSLHELIVRCCVQKSHSVEIRATLENSLRDCAASLASNVLMHHECAERLDKLKEDDENEEFDDDDDDDDDDSTSDDEYLPTMS